MPKKLSRDELLLVTRRTDISPCDTNLLKPFLCAERQAEAATVQEQVDRLCEAVRAAQARTGRKPTGKRSRLRKMLLKPLKMLCVAAPASEHAIALPTGIQDTDLVSHRNPGLMQGCRHFFKPWAICTGIKSCISKASTEVPYL